MGTWTHKVTVSESRKCAFGGAGWNDQQLVSFLWGAQIRACVLVVSPQLFEAGEHPCKTPDALVLVAEKPREI
jgi:hypothetical protein